MDNKKIAIIIVTYNARQYLPDCLSSLEKIDYPKDLYRVIVVDNHSTDSTVEFVKKGFPWAYLIENKENIGFAGGNNIGIRYAIQNDFDYVYLLNQDTAVEPDFLSKAYEAIENNQQIGAVQSRLMFFEKNNIVNSIGNRIHFLGFGYAGGNGRHISQYSFPSSDIEITYPSGAACLIRLSVLKEIGLFHDTFFMYHEDLDLGWRMRLAGYLCALVPKSVVYHKYEFSRSVKKYYYMERNRYLVLTQNYKLGTLFFISPALILFDLAMLLYSFFSGFWREEIFAKIYFFNLKNWKNILGSRKFVQSRRKIKDREILKIFSGEIQFQEKENVIVKYICNPVFRVYFFLVKFFIFW